MKCLADPENIEKVFIQSIREKLLLQLMVPFHLSCGQL